MTAGELYFDGLCEDRNPGGIMCYAYILKANGEVVSSGVNSAPAKPDNTNNIAEYRALWTGLKALSESGKCEQITIHGDSMLVINQLTDVGGIHKPHLQIARDSCLELLRKIGCTWSAAWIERDLNSEADALCRSEYKRLTGKDAPERGKKRLDNEWRRSRFYSVENG